MKNLYNFHFLIIFCSFLKIKSNINITGIFLYLLILEILKHSQFARNKVFPKTKLFCVILGNYYFFHFRFALYKYFDPSVTASYVFKNKSIILINEILKKRMYYTFCNVSLNTNMSKIESEKFSLS